LINARASPTLPAMTLTLPDVPVTHSMSEDDLRLELACALYARGRVSAAGGAQLSGTDLVSFQQALAARDIPRNYSSQNLHDDIGALDRILGA
jgi:predicted HTH domain antitoxin